MLRRSGWARIAVPDDLDASGREPRQAEIIPRGIAGNMPPCAEMFAQIHEPLPRLLGPRHDA
jgi:hypothetical protein